MYTPSPFPFSKFIRWPLKHWISCFFACKFPMDDGASETSNSMDMDIRKKRISSKQQSKCRIGKNDSFASRNRNTGISSCPVSKEKSSSSSWPYFQEEDYIVFCFREDGAFEVVKDFKSEAFDRFDSTNNRSSKPINRKLNYGDIAESVKKIEKKSNIHRNDAFLRHGERINPVEEGEEQKKKCIDMESPSVAESSESNQSESSSGSFSFPVLHCELIGSPAKMPKSESLHLRKHKLHCARFQCFRF